jgi:hypothetical protein
MRKLVFALCLLIPACAASTPEVKEAPFGLNLEVVTKSLGSEPRAPLRYMGRPGQTQRLLLRLSLSSFVSTSMAFADAQLPVVDLVAVVGESFRGTEPGTWGYPITFELIRIEEEDKLDEAARAVLMEELKRLNQVTAAYEIDDRGITRKASVSVPKKVSPRLLALLGNIRTTLLAAALPREDVGIGARWEVDRILSLGDLKVPQTVTYSLLARDSERVRIGVSVRQSAAPQQFPLDEGVTLTVEAYEVSAVGTTLVDLRNFAPYGEMHGLSQMRARVSKGAEAEDISLDSDLMVTLAPLPAEAPTQAAAPAPAPAPTPAPATN